jgi:predicted Zn-dependent protease with MMP-like domain
MSPTWPKLVALAEREVKATLKGLPADLRARARSVPVLYEPVPSPAMIEDRVELDTLGLFVGNDFGHEGTSAGPMPAQILLFLENLWDYSDRDEEIFREEVRATYLHELGHYLGLDEDDLEERGLD